MAADSPVLFPGLRICECGTSIALPRARHFSCLIPSLLQGHIVPLHVPCVHLQTASSLKKCHPANTNAMHCGALLQPHSQSQSPTQLWSHVDSSHDLHVR